MFRDSRAKWFWSLLGAGVFLASGCLPSTTRLRSGVSPSQVEETERAAAPEPIPLDLLRFGDEGPLPHPKLSRPGSKRPPVEEGYRVRGHAPMSDSLFGRNPGGFNP